MSNIRTIYKSTTYGISAVSKMIPTGEKPCPT